jgi:hypothetical protein
MISLLLQLSKKTETNRPQELLCLVALCLSQAGKDHKNKLTRKQADHNDDSAAKETCLMYKLTIKQADHVKKLATRTS